MKHVDKAVMQCITRSRWKSKPMLAVILVVGIVLVFVYKIHQQKLTARAQHVWYPIMPIAERRNRRGGDMIEAAKEAKLPGLEINANIPEKLSKSQSSRNMEFNFFNYLEHEAIICHKKKRLGTDHEGGWTACIAPPFTFKQPCLVYSFGIGEDWRFEDHISDLYHCKVMAFDPTINKTEHYRSGEIRFLPVGLGRLNTVKSKLPFKTFRQILKEDGNSDATIDFLKFDIEFMEWEVIQEMTRGSNSLQNVKQLVFEIHLRRPPLFTESDPSINQTDFIAGYKTLRLVEKAGFKKFGYRENPFCYYKSHITSEQRAWCYDLFYLNMRFVKDEHLRKGKGNSRLSLIA